MPETKTSRVAKLYAQNEIQSALGIAKTFRIGLSKDDRAALQRAHEVMVRGEDFYRAIGKDPAQLVRDGISVLTSKVIPTFLAAK